MAGLTLDSGALIGFERDDHRALVSLKAALLAGRPLTIPSVVVAEVWRGGQRSARLARLLQTATIDSADEAAARQAGEALARTRRADTVDALVLASALRRGDDVLTADVDDLGRLAPCFPGVRVVGL